MPSILRDVERMASSRLDLLEFAIAIEDDLRGFREVAIACNSDFPGSVLAEPESNFIVGEDQVVIRSSSHLLESSFECHCLWLSATWRIKELNGSIESA
jgi:hypothetical protein